MRVLRMNKESVTAMLEAFVHDPLINWRLLNTVEAGGGAGAATVNPGGALTAGGGADAGATAGGKQQGRERCHSLFSGSGVLVVVRVIFPAICPAEGRGLIFFSDNY